MMRHRRALDDLEREIRDHIERETEDNIGRGMSPDDARQAAFRKFGNVTLAREDARAVWVPQWLDHLRQDLRYGARMLLKNPGFTLVAVLSLAIGVGANSAAFSFADALLLRPLPVPRPADVMTVGSTTTIEEFSTLLASYPELVDIRDRATTFSGLVGFTGATMGFAPDAGASPKLRFGMLVSGNFFDVMEVQPQLGRAFRAEEDRVPGRDAVVVLGHDVWMQQFGGDSSIVGRTVRLNGIDFTVIGVAPPRFAGLYQFARVDFYVPLMMSPRLSADPGARPLEARDNRTLTVKGRLKPGVSLADAQTELSVIGKSLERAYPETNKNRTLTARTELQARIAHDRTDAIVVGMLNTLAAVVLFVACANVAGLLTSRGPTRAREIALRLAIGASRRRVIRQLMTESALIAALGGLLGIFVGDAGVNLFRMIQLPTDLPASLSFELDRRAFVFSLAVAMLSSLLFGLMPAVQATRPDLTAVMKANDTVGFGRRRWGRAVLVAGQVAGSVVLLVIATFMYRNFHRQLGAGPGFRTDRLLMMSFDPTLLRYSTQQSQQFFEQVADRARTIPGVTSASLTSSVPMSSEGPGIVNILPEGFQFPPGKDGVTVLEASIDESYFDTWGLTILKGRAFRPTDSADAPRVAIVNEEIARRYWPQQDPIGKRLRLDDERGPWVEIVGLARNSKYTFLTERPFEFLYLPYRQRPPARMTLVTQAAGDAASLAAPLRNLIHSIDAQQPVYNVRTIEEFYRMRVVTAFNVVIGTVAAMGMMGLGLSIVGLYGLVAYGVSRRTKEIGIRMAIGAGQSNVLSMVLRQGMRLAAIGLLIGLLASEGARRLLAAAFGNASRESDVVPFLVVALIVLAVTLFAAYVPARRAARVNPIVALRTE